MSKIIVTGNPVDGFTYHGPFAVLTDQIAEQYEGDWWVADLQTPERDREDQQVPSTDNMIERLNWLHSNMQELEDRGIELPMGDYNDVYGIIEDVREDIEDAREALS